MRRNIIFNKSFLILAVMFFSQILIAKDKQADRVVILTDIEADPDDTQSLVRLLLYSNQIDIKGIVATTSCWMRSSIHPESINKVIEAYRIVQPNLLKHEEGFPEADQLLSLVKTGLPIYGMGGVGKDKDSEGSDWIIKMLEEDDEHPLWISVWGGVNTLAQALYKIRETMSEDAAAKLVSKLRVYTISDQDDSGIWIRNTFPNLFYIVSPGDYYGSGGDATWAGINNYVNGIDNSSISNSWLADNIQQNHGPLGAVYPDVAWGMEGDTPAFLQLIPNGLNNSEHPEFGGWSGRYEFYKPEFIKDKRGSSNSGVPLVKETREIWTNASDTYTRWIPNDFGRNIKKDTLILEGSKVTINRWRDEFQNDFAARMDWCTQTYDEANHPPVPVLNHPEYITVKSGERVSLNAIDTYDPDGDNFSFFWFHYPEAGSYKELITMSQPENVYKANVVMPKVEKDETAHFILKVTDKGTPALARYKRIIVTILPE